LTVNVIDPYCAGTVIVQLVPVATDVQPGSPAPTFTSVVAVGGGVAEAEYAKIATDLVAVDTYAGRRTADDDADELLGIRIESAAVPPVAVAFGPLLPGGATEPAEPPGALPPPPPHAMTATESISAVAPKPRARFIALSKA
jgi:hypothetical protein